MPQRKKSALGKRQPKVQRVKNARRRESSEELEVGISVVKGAVYMLAKQLLNFRLLICDDYITWNFTKP
jgi:hypothetical protein